MMNINQDLDSQRVHRNQTKTQIKNYDRLKEGVLVNSNVPLSDTYNSMVISDNVELPNKLYEKNTQKEKGILPLCISTVGVMGGIFGITTLMKKSTKDNIDVDLAKKLPSMTRNVCINDEINQAIYRMVASPSKKAITAAVGVASLASMAFLGKTFCDGYKDIWVKKKEADIHKDLQEKLIEVETQSFAGKMQINRSMLAQKAHEFSEALKDEDEISKSFKSKNISFKGDKKENKKNELSKNIGYAILGATTLGAIAGLGYMSIRNIRKSNELMKKGVQKVKDAITQIAEQTNKEGSTIQEITESANPHINNIKNLLASIDAKPDYIKQVAETLPFKTAEERKKFVDETIFTINKSTEKANSAMGGSGEDRNTFYSHVNDYKAFFYNWLMDSNNKQFKSLFFGISGAATTAYLGKTTADAIKDVQVKKYNAQTELNLQKRLVPVELKNYKSKKEASINPLCDEFYRQKSMGKPKEELKVMADSILNEIKNGAPYVYS